MLIKSVILPAPIQTQKSERSPVCGMRVAGRGGAGCGGAGSGDVVGVESSVTAEIEKLKVTVDSAPAITVPAATG